MVQAHVGPRKWGISSAGLEHLPYKQGVVGSNPTLPTKCYVIDEVMISSVDYEILGCSSEAERMTVNH